MKKNKSGGFYFEFKNSKIDDSPLFFFEDKICTRVEFLSMIESKSGLQNLANNKTILVWIRDPLCLVTTIFALDQYAEKIVIIPTESSLALVSNFYKLSDAAILLSDIDDAKELDFPLVNPALDFDETSLSLSTNKTTKILIGTSGTTGTPKLAVHDFNSISKATKRDSNKGAEVRWGLLYDPARFAGIQVVTQAILGGSSLVFPSLSGKLEDTLSFFSRVGVNALSATPTLWRKILIHNCDKLSLKIITLGGEISDKQILGNLSRRFKNSKIQHIYASTEAGVGFSVTDGMEGFPVEWLVSPPGGIELKIDCDSQLLIKSKGSALSYVNSDLDYTDGWLQTGDAVQIVDGRVLFCGRINGAINIGGDKVFPEDIEKVIRSHHACATVLISSKKSSITGSLVIAHVILNEGFIGDSVLKKEIIEHCRRHLKAFAVPAFIYFVDDIPFNSATGKLDRNHESRR